MRHFLSVLVLMSAATAIAQESPNLNPPQVSPFQALRSRVSDSDMEDAAKTQTLSVIAQAEKQIADAKTKSESLSKRTAALETVAKRAEDAKAALKELEGFKPTKPEAESLADLETSLATLSASEKASKQALADSELAMTKATQRRVEIDTELPRLATALEERTQQRDNAIASADGTPANEALIADLKSSADLLKVNLAAMQAEKALLDAEAAANLPQANRDLKARQAETIQQQLAVLKTAVEKMRAKDAASRVQKASQQLSDLHPALQTIGQRNQTLANANQTLAGSIETATETLSTRTAKLEELRAAFDEAKSRVDKVGLTHAVGAKLRNLKQGLPSVSAYRLRIRDRAVEINEANYELMEMTDERNERIGLTIDALIRSAQPPVALNKREALREEARELLQEQRTEFLDPTINSQSKYFNTLVSISTVEAEIIQLAEKSEQYINENVLWIRSTPPLYAAPLPTEAEWWFTFPSAWSNAWEKLTDDLLHRAGSWLAAAFALVILVLSRLRLRQEIGELGQKASKSSFTHFSPTAKTLLWTVAVAAPIPLAFWFFASRFSSISGSDRTLSALALACKNLAYTYFPLEFARQVCRPNGLAEAHFDWPASALQKLRRQLKPLLWIAVPMSALSSFLAGGGVGYGNDVLQRYLSLGAVVVLGVFLYRVLHPRRGAPARYLASHSNGWLNRMSYLWFPTVLAIPILLSVLTIVGYHFTSQQIGWRCFESVMLLFGISVVSSLVIRWSLIHRRRLRINQVQAQRALLQQQAADRGEEQTREIPITADTESPEELQEQMRQSRSLIRTAMFAVTFVGLWLVWSDVVPALGIFEKWPLWITTDTVTEMVENDRGELIPQAREIPDPVTVADIGIGILILLITFAAGRNLPGLLEFAVLRQLPLDRSVRYAITTLISYVIVLLGLVMAGGAVGLHWNQIQWMVTALTFGLAFGLQEMFANFIAGIIILFEQPVRVGDVVQIDGVTGVVSKIRIRATTITDWDRKDFIVPNKEFITGKLLNWTRSDEIVRIKVPVGVAYGSDTTLARKLLLEAAEEHKDVLKDPPTLAIFEGFGASSLDFSLRVFVNTYEKRLHICNDLHMAVDEKFRKAGIEISFPQRDLHLRSFPKEMQRFFNESQGPAE